MEPKENLCQPPEYPAEMFSEYIESAKARALRASEIEAILGNDYDLDRLRELVEADRDGRCVVLQCRQYHLYECGFVDGVCPHGESIPWWLKQPAAKN